MDSLNGISSELARELEFNYGIHCRRFLIRCTRLNRVGTWKKLNTLLAVDSVTAHVEDVALDCLVHDICASIAPTLSR